MSVPTNPPLRNGRGRIRCVGSNGWWRDCGEWATKQVVFWVHWLNDEGVFPFCDRCALSMFDVPESEPGPTHERGW